jgi:serralysin
MSENAHGGDDTLLGASNPSPNNLAGDAWAMSDHALGGNDTLKGGLALSNILVGDAFDHMSDDAQGGNDTLLGGNNTGHNLSVSNILYGDGRDMYDNSRGGDDTLTGGDNSTNGPSDRTFNNLYGDAESMHDHTMGGDNILIGGGAGSSNYMYGVAGNMYDNTVAGNNTLISGTGTDYMWGDAQYINGVAASPAAPTGNVVTGADTFVFAPSNGNDFINDFRQSDGDRIDVSAYGFQSLTQMMITFDGANTKIGFDADDSVTLVGFTDPSALRTSDFILA